MGINKPIVSIVVATDEQNAVGSNGSLLCYLPNDLKHFKQLTAGHIIVMGRKTFDSLPKGALPNRTNIVLTKNKSAIFKDCIVFNSIDELWQNCNENEELFFIGGGQIYKEIIDITDNIYLTRIHHSFEDADTFFPQLQHNEWLLIEKEDYKADEKHPYNYSFETYIRRK